MLRIFLLWPPIERLVGKNLIPYADFIHAVQRASVRNEST